MTQEQTFEGGCLCGAIRYRSTVSPVRGVICHCTLCRRHSGAPILAFVHFPLEAFTWVKGEPTRYRSSKFAERGFCSKCGSTISMHEEVLCDRVQVVVGSLDDPNRVKLDDHVWTDVRIAWFDVKDDLPRHHQSSPAVASKTSGTD
jgi:hypothetical protein